MLPKSSFLYAVDKTYTQELAESSKYTTPKIVNIFAAYWMF